MTKYRYVGNKRAEDGTSILVVGDKEVSQGEEVSLTKAELEPLEELYNFEEVTSSDKDNE